MSSFLNQLPALIGVIVGALGSYFATSRNESARWKRHQASRWDAERKAAYAAYGHAIKMLTTQCARLAAARGVDNWFQKVDLEEGHAEYMRLSAERGAVWESVLLLGTAETIEAARAWHMAVDELQKFADGRRTDFDQWEVAYYKTGIMRDAYYQQARIDLSITG